MKCFYSNFIEVFIHYLQNVQNEDDLPDTNHLAEEGKHNTTYCWLLQLIKHIILISRSFRVLSFV